MLGFGDVRDFSDDSFGDEMDEELDVELDVSFKGMRSRGGTCMFQVSEWEGYFHLKNEQVNGKL